MSFNTIQNMEKNMSQSPAKPLEYRDSQDNLHKRDIIGMGYGLPAFWV